MKESDTADDRNGKILSFNYRLVSQRDVCQSVSRGYDVLIRER